MGNSEFGRKAPLELLCLMLLNERDMYGYEMVQELSKRSDGRLSVNLTTLYMALRRLNERNYVVTTHHNSEDSRERSRTYYHAQPSAQTYREMLFQEYQQTVEGVELFLANTKGGRMHENRKKRIGSVFR